MGWATHTVTPSGHPDEPGQASDEPSAGEPPPSRITGRRLLSLVAAAAPMPALCAAWRSLAASSPAATVAVTLGFTVVLVAVVAALTLPESRLARLDVAVLLTAIGLFLTEQWQVFTSRWGARSDEARLGVDALRALVAGHDPYAMTLGVGHGTHLMTGAPVDRYQYPPLTLELGWLLDHVKAGLGAPWVVGVLAVVATGVVLFAVLPAHLRPAAVVAVFGFGLLAHYAASGFTVVVALPFLCLAAWSWTSIGRSGRLAPADVARAAALGAAISTQQLSWCIAVLAVAAIWRVRRGNLPATAAAGVTAGFVGVTLAAAALLNLPFVIAGAASWWSAVTSVFTQQAGPYGAGLILITRYLLPYSGQLSYYTAATACLFLAFFALTLVGIRRVALAVPVLGALFYLINTRSNVEYLVAFVPLWLVWATTADTRAISASLPIRVRGPVRLSTWPRRAAAVAAACVPTLVLLGVAFTRTPPVTMADVHVALAPTGRVRDVQMLVTNSSGVTVRPTFAVGPFEREKRWAPATGPVVLAPHTSRTVILEPVRAHGYLDSSWDVSATTATPAAVVTAHLPPGTVGPPLHDGPPGTGRHTSGSPVRAADPRI